MGSIRLPKVGFWLDFPQRSPEWLAARYNSIGGSDIGTLCGVNKYKTQCQLLFEKSSHSPPEFKGSTATAFGVVFEPLNKYVAEMIFGNCIKTPGMWKSTQYSAHVSPDGVGKTNSGQEVLFEFKCPYSRHCTVIGKSIPSTYMYQLQQSMLLYPFDWSYYQELVISHPLLLKPRNFLSPPLMTALMKWEWKGNTGGAIDLNTLDPNEFMEFAKEAKLISISVLNKSDLFLRILKKIKDTVFPNEADLGVHDQSEFHSGAANVYYFASVMDIFASRILPMEEMQQLIVSYLKAFDQYMASPPPRPLGLYIHHH